MNKERKSSEYRTSGLDPVFKQTGNLDDFQHRIMTHLRKYGLDTISYLPDPVNPTTMVSVVENHSKFTTTTATMAHNALRTNFDAYDLKNDVLSAEFLTKSLDPELLSIVHSKVSTEDPFVVIWMTAI